MVNVDEYRKKSTRPFTTRTGETFTIDKLSPFRLIEVFGELGFSLDDLQEESGKRERGLELAKVLLPECVRELAPAGKGDDQHLALDEIKDLTEIEDLLNAVLEAMGVGEEAQANAEKFRVKPDGEDGGAGGEDVPGLGAPDAAPGA